MNERTGGELICDHLIAQGVPYVCGIPGHGDMGIFDAFKDRADRITVLQTRHEQSAGHIADAYFRACGRPLATLTSIGPGSANLTTALATAYVDSQALISITGGVQSYMDGTGVLQEIERQRDADFPSVLRPVVKRGFTVHRADQLQRALHRAFNVALGGRPGPVHIDVPIDVQALTGEGLRIDAGRHAPTHSASHPDPDGIEAILAVLLEAQRPVILAGGGTIHAGAQAELRRVAEMLQAPVLATMMGKGVFPEDHPLAAEHTGANGTICGNHFSREADVILAVGTRFAEQTSSSYRHGESFSVPPTRIVQIDIDPREIGKNYPVQVGVVADARAGLAALADALAERRKQIPDRREYILEAASWKGRWRALIRERWDPGVLSMSQAIAALREVLPREGIVIASAGHPQIQMFQEFVSYQPRTWITPGGYSTMGFTVPAAIGAKLAAPDVPVVGVAGDGDFLMSIQELALAVQEGISVVYLVLNNIGWTSIRDFQRGMFGEGRDFAVEFRRRSDGELISPDFAAIAEGFGATAIRVDELAQLRPALQAALRTEGPVVVEAQLARDPRSTEGINAGYWDLPKPAYLNGAAGVEAAV
ncbi:MAG TPA: thiamine pyrophosphate-binding protein [Solirubrobacteraceae bacterium]|nr:thiamine pyrophosphate-binding protein [Solirubrobacteraceae bacterium]